MAKKIVTAENFTSREDNISFINTYVYDFTSSIKKICMELKKVAQKKMEANALSKRDLQKFVENYNNFIKFSSWEWFLLNKLNLKEENKNYFLDLLESKLSKLQPINEAEFLDIKLKSIFSKYEEKIAQIDEKDKI